MRNNILEYAYAGLLHDIGKFYQRTSVKNILSDVEKNCTPISDKGYHTHIHSGYTSKFFKEYLMLHGPLERSASEHHLKNDGELDIAIKKADQVASKVDRSDEEKDYDGMHTKTRYSYITSRLQSIMSNVDFGSPKQNATFQLGTVGTVKYPTLSFTEKSPQDSAKEYKELFMEFLNEVEKDMELQGDPSPYKFHRVFSLLYKYTTLIPSSTYETNKQTVSLFDHLKLTSALASCYALSTSDEFYMVEFDISGIQKFIYQVTEGGDTKRNVAKSLRGRSSFVTLITNAVTYALLNEFSLTQSNVIFNTGGGALVLLPNLEDTEARVSKIFDIITSDLYARFNTSLTLVYAIEKINELELQLFKTEKSLSLKATLDNRKKKKFAALLSEDFTRIPFKHDNICELCNDNIVNSKGYCDTCNDIIAISDYYTNNDKFTILYDFENVNDYNSLEFLTNLGFVRIYAFNNIPTKLKKVENYYYIDAVNNFNFGNPKLLANLVPKDNYNTSLNFEDIVKTLDSSYGDQKLGILKMDVDNLGAIFAFGLKQGDEKGEQILQRSLSKYLTLSRFMELFFSKRLKDICLELSGELQDKFENIFYINYAGGDDLVILGPVYGVIQLANRINQEFKKYVTNDKITLSAGIYIQNSKKPIRFGISKADEALDMSKNFEEGDYPVKNSITIMDKTVSFVDFNEVLEDVEKYREYLCDDKISLSRTSFYNIMSNIRDSSMEDFYSIIPILQYTLFRQIKDEKLRIEIAQKITTSKNMYELSKVILMMKLTILFTREDD